MAVQVYREYILGNYTLEPDRRSLNREGVPVRITGKPFQVLVYLIEHRDRLVSRAELFDRFWEGHDVYDVALSKCVGAIRKALDDKVDTPRFIETRWAEGYRYIGPFEEQHAHAGPSVVEIEKSRGLKIVIEEEFSTGIQDSDAAIANLPSEKIDSIKSKSVTYRFALVLSLVLIALATSAVILYRSRATAKNSVASPIRSIAVLPLKNLTGDPAQDYFGDGMSESLITELSRVNGLKVVSRASAFTFKDKEVDVREIGARLGVAAVLEGSVRKSGDKVRVETRLVSAEDGRIIWTGESYDRALKDIFVMQDEIACSVVAGLRVKLCGEGEPLFRQHTNNIEAYRAYLKGRYFINAQYSEIGPLQALTKAAEYFEQAIALDSNYALGYAGLADAYTQLLWFSSSDPRPMISKAKAAALKAVELDDTLAEAHTALSAAYLHDWNFDGAGLEIERAVALNPGYAWAHHEYSTYLATVGRGDALAEIQKAEELDPLNIAIIADTGNALLGAGKYDEAMAEFQKAREIDPNFVNGANIGPWYVDKGRYEEGIKELEAAIARTGQTPDRLMSLAIGYAKTGKKEKAARLFDKMKRISKKQYVPNTFFAFVYVALGEKDRAFEYLERAYREHDISLLQLRGLRLEGLRSDSRFQNLVRRVGLPE